MQENNQLGFLTLSLFSWRHENQVRHKDWITWCASAKCRQAKQLWLKLLHAPESQRGLLGKARVQVVVRNHHHLHPCSQRRLHTVGSVFKHQALSKDRGDGNKVILSYKPIWSTGFHLCRCHRAKTKNKHKKMGNRSTISIFRLMNLIFFREYHLPLQGGISF